MSDLKNPNLIVIKGVLVLLLGMIAALFLILKTSRLDVAILLLIAIWAFCRFYYFAFYVIEHYVDGDYKFTGLYSAFVYLCRRSLMRNRNGQD